MNHLLSKSELRKVFAQKRNHLSPQRRKNASESLKKTFIPHLETFSNVLSFASMAHEINLTDLNIYLCKKKKLFLPRICENNLWIYQVDELKDLKKSSLSFLEPDPNKCRLVELNEISSILVPGLVFDKHCNRLGYGKGHYDRLLSQIEAPCFGIGFFEQLSATPLPQEEHDKPLYKLYLF